MTLQYRSVRIAALSFSILAVPLFASAALFERPLTIGSSGTDVSVLQAYLKGDGYFNYPTITGFYGAATYAGVSAFQRTHGLESVGSVGPLTRALLNGAQGSGSNGSNGFAMDDAGAAGNANGTSSTPCLSGFTCIPGTNIVQPVAPGGGYSPGFGGGGGASASVAATPAAIPDTTAPQILAAVSGTPTDASITITWTTDEPATSKVEYGATSSYGSQSSDATLTTSHSLTLSGLSANTTYHFRIDATDASSNTSHNNDDTFTTYTSGAQSLFASMTSTPDTTHAGAINQFFIDASSIASKLDGLWMAGADAQSSGLNWLAPTGPALSSHGTVTFTADRGWLGGTTGSYLGTGIILTQGTHFSKDDNSFGGAISSTSPNSTEHTIGGVIGSPYGGTFIRPNSSTSNGASVRDNTTASQVFTTTIENAHWDVVRAGAGNGYKAYKNGSTAATFASTSAPSVTPPPIELYLLALDNAGASTGTASNLGQSRVAMAYLGSSLSDLEVQTLYYATNKYLAAIGEETLAVLSPSTFTFAMSPSTLTNGATVTYTIATTSLSNPSGSVELVQSGDLTDSDFDQTLDQAIATAAAGTTGVTFNSSTNTLTFASNFAGTFTFSRTLTATPAAGATHSVSLQNPVTVSVIEPTATAIAGSPTLPSNIAMAKGANVSGAEFGTVPGTINTDYAYPSDADIDYYATHGFTTVRVPFRWERVQKTLGGSLDVVGDGSGDFEKLEHVVDRITGDGMIAIIDPHNFGRYVVSGTSQLMGSSAVPAQDFDDLWSKLATQFKGNTSVWFNLMNEPSGSLGATTWERLAQSATNAIRATGALNRILVPGDGSSAGSSWTSSGNSTAMLGYVDPANNAIFDVHQYLDSDNSGTHGTCTAGAGSRLSDFISWAQSHSKTGFLGEFAGGDPNVSGQEQCATEINSLVTNAQSSGVFAGWTVWGGGTRWSSSYIFRLEPTSLTDADTNLMTIYKAFLP